MDGDVSVTNQSRPSSGITDFHAKRLEERGEWCLSVQLTTHSTC